MNNVIYIDNYYPYNYKGETFLENEINFIKGKHNRINRYIFPIFGKNIDKIDNLSQQKINIIEPKKNSTINIVFWSIISLFSIDFYYELMELIKTKRLRIKNVIKCIYFIALGKKNARILIKYIRRNIETGSSIILYSYWMHIQAYIVIKTKCRLKDEYNIRAITRCHRFDVYEYAEDGYIPCRKAILNNIDKIYSISNDAIEYIKNNYRYQNINCVLSMLGTDDFDVHISPKTKTLKIVSCSWMRPVKRNMLIFDAIKNTSFPIEWVHFGDGEEFEKISELISKNKNQNLKCRLLGNVPNNKIIDYYKKEDVNIFINVSKSEGIPVSIMEAMSFGKIIIATDVGGTSEIVKNGENGFLLSIDVSSNDIYNKIKDIYYLSNKQYQDMSEKSRKIWEEKCNARVNYEKFEKDMMSIN